jgi:hypothetical protein
MDSSADLILEERIISANALFDPDRSPKVGQCLQIGSTWT